MMTLITRISQDIQVPAKQVAAVLDLLDQGATIPFIARYRKEQTGSLDEVAITRIRDRHQALAALDARKTAILKSLSERDLLTPELEKTILNAETLAALEDRFVKDPNDVVTVHQPVQVRVLAVDKTQKRISLSMKPG